MAAAPLARPHTQPHRTACCYQGTAAPAERVRTVPPRHCAAAGSVTCRHANPPRPRLPCPPAAAAKWAAAEQRISAASMGIGLLVFLLSWRFLYHFTETTGQVGCLPLPPCVPPLASLAVRPPESCLHSRQHPSSLHPPPPLPQILGGVLMLSGAVGWVGGAAPPTSLTCSWWPAWWASSSPSALSAR